MCPSNQGECFTSVGVPVNYQCHCIAVDQKASKTSIGDLATPQQVSRPATTVLCTCLDAEDVPLIGQMLA